MSRAVAVIVCAAGKGERAGFSENKLFAPLDGKTVLERTLSKFARPDVAEIFVAYSKADEKRIFALADEYRFTPVLGGETRFQSVYNALQRVTAPIVLVHDGARPFVTDEIIDGCIESVLAYGSGVCAVPASDTVAIAPNGEIESTPTRKDCYLIQTPQGFYTDALLNAYELAQNSPATFTDDSSVFAYAGGLPRVCVGARSNIKLTYPEDFAPAVRTGFGVDTHAFGKEQNFVTLCGVQIPSESGLIAHSDGDVALHAVMDALLSAAGKRDIGYYFPDTDERWKDASSLTMLAAVVGILKKDGLGAKNVSVAIQAEKPKLAKYIESMQNTLAAALYISPDCVGITAGTNEKLGYVGEGKGITVYASVLLKEVK